MLGRADSEFTNGLQQITDIVVLSGSNLQNLNLPIDPNGVVYDALQPRADRGRDAEPRRRRRADAAAGDLLRRSEPAGAGHARRRLLQVRSEFLRSGVPERRQLPDRVTPPPRALPRRASPRSFRRPARRRRRVRRADVPGAGRRRRAGDGAVLRSRGVRVRAAGVGAQRSAGTSYHLHIMLDNSGGRARARCSTTTSRSIRSRRVVTSPRRRRRATSRAASSCRTSSRSRTVST